MFRASYGTAGLAAARNLPRQVTALRSGLAAAAEWRLGRSWRTVRQW